MNARIDFDAILEHRRLRDDQCADTREEALEQARAQIKLELLKAFMGGFAGQDVVIPFATRQGSVISQDLNQALGDVWADAKVERLFLEMQAAPVEKLAAARSTFQAAAALAYIAGQADALAEHRVNNLGVYARFDETYCSQCGGAFGPGNSGFSHCTDHQGKRRAE